MQARFDVVTIDGGYSVYYRNLQTGEGMDCGTHEGEWSDLLVWMVEESNGAETVIFLDKKYFCMVYERNYEGTSTVTHSGTAEVA